MSALPPKQTLTDGFRYTAPAFECPNGSPFFQLPANGILQNIPAGKQIVYVSQRQHDSKLGIPSRTWREVYSVRLRARAEHQEPFL